MDYKAGDFVMLKDVQKFSDNRPLHRDFNVFEISEMLPDGFSLRYIGETVSKDDILPIPINGKDDRWIYYHPIVAASVIGCGHVRFCPPPVHTTDYSYYFDSFARSTFENKTFQEIIREEGFKYVHEVQHFLSDEFHQNDALKINYGMNS